MEYDESRVYTALNAEKLKVGSKVIVADNLASLKQKIVAADENIRTLKAIEPEVCMYRFTVGDSYAFAYLVEGPSQFKCSAQLKCSYLKIGDIIRSNDSNTTAMVTQIEEDKTGYDLRVYAGDSWFDDAKLRNWEKVANDR